MGDRRGGESVSEMLERVARAIWQESVGRNQWSDWDTFSPDAWGRVRSIAQACAAIEAMRNITPEMLQAGQGWDGIPAIWGRMIDKALGE